MNNNDEQSAAIESEVDNFPFVSETFGEMSVRAKFVAPAMLMSSSKKKMLLICLERFFFNPIESRPGVFIYGKSSIMSVDIEGGRELIIFHFYKHGRQLLSLLLLLLLLLLNSNERKSSFRQSGSLSKRVSSDSGRIKEITMPPHLDTFSYFTVSLAKLVFAVTL